ncbi:hypothetical protein CAC01_18050 [Streptomyces sp. CLI2509]|nr:hypothetical protein CAC01_18050 [Streptomyces sp. CLI2509]
MGSCGARAGSCDRGEGEERGPGGVCVMAGGPFVRRDGPGGDTGRATTASAARPTERRYETDKHTLSERTDTR